MGTGIMAGIPIVIKLQNQVKNYDWGSEEWIPSFLGEENPKGEPWAELWMGTHPAAPSRLICPGTPLLSEMFGPLPFLLKLLAAEKPLSIQAHPDLKQAITGFEKENRQNIPLDAPYRSYRDQNDKSEIICAVTPFTALCGFRNPDEICLLLEILLTSSEGETKDALQALLYPLKQRFDRSEEISLPLIDKPLGDFFSAFLNLVNPGFASLIKDREALLIRDYPEYKKEWKLCSHIAGLHPEDPGIIAPLFLNLIQLKPLEAISIPAGILHSYIYGLGIELMGNSDNVLRGGLTSKYIDKPELMNILNFNMHKPDIFTPGDDDEVLFPCTKDFALSLIRNKGPFIKYENKTPAILFVSDGSVTFTKDSIKLLSLEKGESAFIPVSENPGLQLSGNFNIFLAHTIT